jgi:hypothetical protein
MPAATDHGTATPAAKIELYLPHDALRCTILRPITLAKDALWCLKQGRDAFPLFPCCIKAPRESHQIV